jgi:hypothetical protein
MNKTWLWWGALAVWCVAALVVTSDPTGFFAGIIVAGVALVLALAWLVRLILAIRSGGETRRQWLSGLGLEALVGMAVVGVCYLGVPQKVRFGLSEPALTAFAKDALAHPQKPLGNPRIGLYQLYDGQVSEGEVSLTLGSNFLDNLGFVYAPASPKERSETTFKPLQGSWYLWTHSF